MDNLMEACKRFNETKEKYNKVLHDHQELRRKCDDKLKVEMIQLTSKFDDICSCALILLETFHHYGDVIKFPINIYEDRDDCLIFTFSREGYYISMNNETNILYKSSLSIEDLPTSCYEILVLNKDVVIDKVSRQIQMFFENETNKMNEDIANENAYYDMLTRSLFPEESNQQ